jgi:hypothetical protein
LVEQAKARLTESDFLARQRSAKQNHLYRQPFRSHNFRMDGDIIDQVEPHIREILRICSAVDLEGKELQELNALVGQRSKLVSIPPSPVR